VKKVLLAIAGTVAFFAAVTGIVFLLKAWMDWSLKVNPAWLGLVLSPLGVITVMVCFAMFGMIYAIIDTR